MTLWFSGSAVLPALTREWGISSSQATWLTLAVQLGFVAGTLLSAALNLSDVINPRYVFGASCLLGAMANASFALWCHSAHFGIVLRFLTGMFLAGVYPPGMKIIATWFREQRGFAIGMLIGALTLGKATPYLINYFFTLERWKEAMLSASGLAVVGAFVVMGFVNDGPFHLPASQFNFHYMWKVFREPALRLANFGYLGHMWELYAMWTWTPVFIRESVVEWRLRRGMDGAAGLSHHAVAEAVSFGVIGAGFLGCVLAGWLADRWGRTRTTIVALAISGACSLSAGLFFGSSLIVLAPLMLVWGFSVVADSAQFSACITELCQPEYMGTALTMQTSVGFLLTTATIELIPHAEQLLSWRWAFALLALGPLFGIYSMIRLRHRPEAIQIAGGRK
ncbi:MAG: MFS transporter [Acidobacteriia bacterium]|nr:MFS transporter [Terriglobia bacterium]